MLGLALKTFAAPATIDNNTARRFSFRMPQLVRYLIPAGTTGPTVTSTGNSWLRAVVAGTTNAVEFSSRIAVQWLPGSTPATITDSSTLKISRNLGAGWYIFQAPNAQIAVEEAARIATLPGIRISYPVMRRAISLHGPYARRPNDLYFDRQWNLENRAADGTSLGLDLNVRAAWSFTRGEGVTLAIVDDGVELSHPEFRARTQNDLHFTFDTGVPSGLPSNSLDNHGTTVTGLAAAEWNNRKGMSGVAPAVEIASWKIFSGFSLAASDEQLMDMFQYRSDAVDVQNHSWGNSGAGQLAPTPLERLGLSNAISLGRQGRGIIMVRSGGNGRGNLNDVNDDAYASDPRVVTVASVRRDGRAASYSTRGACLLVAAPGGATDANIFTTDRVGAAGFNTDTYTNDFADYVYSSVVQGTSFSAPQVSGLAALLLSVNPNLTYRDVQLILALASRHFDAADPDLATNGAGLLVSHNDGFGVPDAGFAVDLARRWMNRPPVTELRYASNLPIPIPDDGLHVLVRGSLPGSGDTAAIPGTPSMGIHADDSTAALELVDIGIATPPITNNLQGKAALIQRGNYLFIEKIENAALAGAAFAIIYNNVGATERLIMGGTDYASIPALLIGHDAGEALRAQLESDPELRVQMAISPARHTFVNMVTNTLVCEQVGLRVATTHDRRGDLRITLLSPAGTRSVLQRVNYDEAAGPSDWTYYSVHHFLESSRGQWKVEITDEQPSNTGTVTALELILRGVAISDSDGDGLDDDWEQAQLGNLQQGPRDDPDADGYSNALEQVLGTSPDAADRPLLVDLSVWNPYYLRLSWPGIEDDAYEILGLPDPTAAADFSVVVQGQFPVTERFITATEIQRRFFRLRISTPGLQLPGLTLLDKLRPGPNAQP